MSRRRNLNRPRGRAIALLSTGLLAAVSAGAPAVSARMPQTFAADGTVERAAAATQQARRLNVDARKPIFPMQTTPMCYILDNFGAPRSGGRIHEGTDMLAKLDQEVYAV